METKFMDDLVSILDSFQPGWKEKDFVEDLTPILKEMVIPTYAFLKGGIKSNPRRVHGRRT
jgi:hypothetical protein